MTYQIRQAQRGHAKPLIGLYAESGAGKTYSALLLARGFVGPEGRICMIETEAGRGEAYADPGEYPEIGGYEVIPMRERFSPQDYGQAITVAEQAGVDALIIDSGSAEWEGAGGVLSMAAQNQADGKKGPIVWQKPKMAHQEHFMLRITQSPIALVIVCMRAKYPMREVPINGRKQWVRSDELHPKQADDILYEMFVHGWIDVPTHCFHLTRCTSKGLLPVFADGKPISLETGQGMKAWASSTGATPAAKPNGHDRDLPAEAKAAARRGVEAFRAFWKGLTKADRATLQPDLSRYRSTAEDADQTDDVPEDPFDDGPPRANSSEIPNGSTEPPAEDANAPEGTSADDASGQGDEKPGLAADDRLGELRAALAGCHSLDAVDTLEADHRATTEGWPAADLAKADNAFMARKEELSR